jgi:hypothetical protein
VAGLQLIRADQWLVGIDKDGVERVLELRGKIVVDNEELKVRSQRT